jgi:hypothetical protein
MASCPVARSITAFHELEVKMVAMGDRLAETREFFIATIAAIKASVEQLKDRDR